MPFLKKPKLREPLWKEADYKAQKKGIRGTITNVNGDQYTGEWLNNMKHGKGTYKWIKNGAVYDGDWKNDKQNGFGTYSIPNNNGNFKKEYCGGWKNGLRHGYGTQYYKEKEFFEGEWYANKRSGWGRLYYGDGRIYEGEWFDDQRNGQGMLRQVDEDRYEGSWMNDKKNGIGKYFYTNKGQLYDGVWVNDVPKCGMMKDCERETAPNPTQYPITELKLADINSVVREAENKFLSEL